MQNPTHAFLKHVFLSTSAQNMFSYYPIPIIVDKISLVFAEGVKNAPIPTHSQWLMNAVQIQLIFHEVHDVYWIIIVCHVVMISPHSWQTTQKKTWNKHLQKSDVILVSRTKSSNCYNPYKYMVVSQNRGTPNSSMLMGMSIVNHPYLWGHHPFQETPIYIYIIPYDPISGCPLTPFEADALLADDECRDANGRPCALNALQLNGRGWARSPGRWRPGGKQNSYIYHVFQR